MSFFFQPDFGQDIISLFFGLPSGRAHLLFSRIAPFFSQTYMAVARLPQISPFCARHNGGSHPLRIAQSMLMQCMKYS